MNFIFDHEHQLFADQIIKFVLRFHFDLRVIISVIFVSAKFSLLLDRFKRHLLFSKRLSLKKDDLHE